MRGLFLPVTTLAGSAAWDAARGLQSRRGTSRLFRLCLN